MTAQLVVDPKFGGDVSRVRSKENNAIAVAGSELQRQLNRGDEDPQGVKDQRSVSACLCSACYCCPTCTAERTARWTCSSSTRCGRCRSVHLH